MSRSKKLIILSLLSLALISIFILYGLNSRNLAYFLSSRIPKLLAIVMTGGAIAISSLIFQTISNNRILTPSVLGLDSLYILIQTLIIFIFGSTSLMVVNKNINFIISVLLMIVFSRLLFKRLFNKKSNNIMTLLLVGLILGTLFRSLSSFMQMMIDPNEFLHIQDKMFASFNNINTSILIISGLSIIIVGIIVLRESEKLDVISLGREQAINLGLDYDSVIYKMLLLVSILISVSTALVGPITFLGLLVVNLAREALNTFEHRYLIIGSSLISIVALVGGQLLVERIFNFGTPISVIINFIGGIYFISLLIKESAK